MGRNGRNAPISDLPHLTPERLDSTPNQAFTSREDLDPS